MKFTTQPVPTVDIAQGFGENLNPLYAQLGLKGHTGIDLASPRGTPVYCPTRLYFHALGSSAAGGFHIDCISDPDTDDNSYLVEFLHLGTWNPMLPILNKYKYGNEGIPEGAVIGQIGVTGMSTGPHLHFEVRPGKIIGGVWQPTDVFNGYGGAVDPMPFIENWNTEKQGTSTNPIYERILSSLASKLISWLGK